MVKVIEREKPDGIFAAFGGQTALNCAVKLYQAGVFEKYNVKVLGCLAGLYFGHHLPPYLGLPTTEVESIPFQLVQLFWQ